MSAVRVCQLTDAECPLECGPFRRCLRDTTEKAEGKLKTLRTGSPEATVTPRSAMPAEAQLPPMAVGAGGSVPCPNEPLMGEYACKNRAQCWEPCGELGHSAEHARVAPDQATHLQPQDAKDARSDSVDLAGGAGGNVHAPGLAGDELTLFRQTIEDFADCGETETDYETLVGWVQRGLLECTNFRPTAAAHRILEAKKD